METRYLRQITAHIPDPRVSALLHSSPSPPPPPHMHTLSSEGAMISFSSSRLASPRSATLSVMMKANDQRRSRRDSSLECTLPAARGGGGG